MSYLIILGKGVVAIIGVFVLRRLIYKLRKLQNHWNERKE